MFTDTMITVMDPVIDTDWFSFKNDPIDEPPMIGNVTRSWQWRETGVNPPNTLSNKTVLENIAEDILVQKSLKIRCCDLPGYPRSTFLMVFSPDGTKVASTHGNHNVYVSELASGKHVRILKGHPRTPWCIAFHPSHPQLIGSGCLGGQVRVWDISSGGSEVWNVRNVTVIASIAFHPREQLLVIATSNELYFWDWSQPAPFTKVSTKNINEKVRYVAFDSLGYKLITGISLSTASSNPINVTVHQRDVNTNNNQNNQRRDDPDEGVGNSGGNRDSSGSTQDLIVNSYQNLVQRYDSLVRNYQRLFMVRHRLTATPLPPSTTDRGTDPMETDPSPESNSYTRVARTYSAPPQPANGDTSMREGNDSGDGEGSSSQIFNLDTLSFDNASTRVPSTSSGDHSTFGSRQSAFQPLNDSSRRTFRTVDQNERTVRLLPNPFSPTNTQFTPSPSTSLPRGNRLPNNQQQVDTNSNSSRTSIFLAYRPENTESEPTPPVSRSCRLPNNQQQNDTNANSSRISIFQTYRPETSSESRPNLSVPRWSRSPTNQQPSDTNANSSRTSIFLAYRPEAPESAPNTQSAVLNSQQQNETNSNLSRMNLPHSSRTEIPEIGTGVSVPRRCRFPNNQQHNDNNINSSQTSTSHGLIPETISRTCRSPRNQQQNDVNSNSSRTSIFHAFGPETPEVLDLSYRRSAESQRATLSALNENLETNMTDGRNAASTSIGNTRRQSNASNTSLPMSGPIDAQTINESLDLIRDILRDSGTRLLNLITNMSLSTLANVERRERLPRRRTNSRAQSDDNEVSERRTTRPRVRLFSSSLRQEFLSSSSESDSDQSPEVNIFRTRNSTFREESPRSPNRSTPRVLYERIFEPTEEILTPQELIPPTEEVIPPSEGPVSSTEGLIPPTERLFFELGESQANEPTETESGGINVTANSSRFHVRTQSNDPDAQSNNTTRNSASNTDQRNQNSSEFNPNRPSTSRDNFWAGGAVFPPEEAYRKVRGGVNALQKHTMQLTNLWLRGNRITMRELRNMWENLRRRILMLHRETGRQDVPSHYTRSLLERCMMLTDDAMSDNITRGSSRNFRSNPRHQETSRNSESNNDESVNCQGNLGGSEPSTSTGGTNDNRPTLTRTVRPVRHQSAARSAPSQRSRLQASYRWRPEDELRRRSRNPRLLHTYGFGYRPRMEVIRAQEISATRHEIRMRAMQVLSVMFNMMMMCLEERGLSQLIINMLRTLKKALALTCLMLMTNRNVPRTTASPQRVHSVNVIRLENVDHSGPVNVDGPDEVPQSSVQSETAERTPSNNKNVTPVKREVPSSAKASTSNTNNLPDNTPSTSNMSMAQRWSNRLAVQISAANRNTSATARNRRELYIESKRLKALHRTNPIAHPLMKRKALPPVSTYRIPALRFSPRKSLSRNHTARVQPVLNEPVAGPSGINSNNTEESSRLPSDVMNEFEFRINLIRMAHLQAVRLRNDARRRFRRLQTIRLYTPSSVREMFTLQPNNENQQENRSSLQNSSEPPNRRPLAWSRILARDRMFYRNLIRQSEESGQIQEALSDAGIALMQVHELPTNNSENQGNPPLRLPRIHEYLQPIILAQNAMVVDEEGNGDGNGGGAAAAARRAGGMAGLLDAGIISEALPAPMHRVQAWDFTTGDPPDIADNTKNIVVQKCRIHNDASIDISKDGRLLVALLPVQRMRNTNHWLGVYSLEWSRLGQCLHTAAFEHSAVSVALSPTARHLAVGLGARRFSFAPARTNVFALLYRLDPFDGTSRTGLSPIKELEQTWEHGFTSLNCLRWAPQPGQGLVYANNTGQLIIMS